VIISTDVAKEKPPEYDEKMKRDIFKNPNEIQHETQVENPVLVHEEVEVTDHFETANDMESETARGQEDAISDIPLGGTGVSGSIGVGGGGMAGCFGYRDGGGRKHAVARFGGSPATESAVEAALQWLARHQEADGSWDGMKYGNCGHGNAGDLGLTGLATLAYLGAGYTHKTGKFKDTVDKALKFMLAAQHKDPEKDKKILGAIYFTEGQRDKFKTKCESWWVWGSYGYNHAICGLALAEAYGMTSDETLREPAQLAVDYSINIHQQPYYGWRYRARYGQADTSNTGWFVMQLKSAKVAGLKVDGAGFQGAQTFLDKVTEPDGRARYTEKLYPPMHQLHKPDPMMTSIGMVCRQFMGAGHDDKMVSGAATYLGKFNPNWKGEYSEAAGGDKTFYYWYYGTLGVFQAGGETWNKWNSALKSTLVDNQCRANGQPLDGSVNDKDGSWDPWAGGTQSEKGSRVFSTTLGALCLEVYYRYLPMYTK
jgi:hypothetical protein